MCSLRSIVVLLPLVWVSGAVALDPAAVARLGADDSEEKIAAIRELVREGDPASARLLHALSRETVSVSEGRVLRAEGERFFDAVTGAEVVPAPAGRETITVNNRVRRELEGALAVLKLLDPDPKVRLAAVRELGDSVDPQIAPVLERARARESDPAVRSLLSLIHARATLRDPDPAARLAAVRVLGASSNRAEVGLLQERIDPAAEPDSRVRARAQASLRLVESRLAAADSAGRLFTGLSLGSILLLAALGLAITYGVMGVINMAHGELLMIGAYSAFAVQRIFTRFLPGAVDWYVAASIPVGFAAAFLVGIAMERTVIRFLYGRPLETLLATWGLSLFTIQVARTLFGPQNVQVPNPSWMSGGIDLAADIVLPWNRIVIIAFSLGVLATVWLLLNRTRLGMFVRAVTQNRSMASCVGVPTGRVDAMAFGLGAGIAGLGGVALSQIANVGPEMGQGYIVDSFLVVVLGGVGQLAGAVWAALGLGVASKFLEASWGAVLAKILMLVLVMAVIRRRPQGLFAPKGRTAEGA
jgi:urea transport system permease protein